MSEATGESAGPEPSARDLFLRLRSLIDGGVIGLELDLKRLDHMDSPVGVEADSNLWIYPGIVATGLAFWFIGPYGGVAVAVAALALFLTAGRAYVRRRLVRRVHQRALQELEIWRKLWRFGGVRLVPHGGRAGPAQPCVAPEGNWMALVRTIGGES
jgi:hypothetical protein